MRHLLREHTAIKRTIWLPLMFVILVVLTFVLLNSPFLFTYRSRANEDVANSAERSQNSQDVVVIAENLPSCILRFEYIPITAHSQETCFVRYSCRDAQPTESSFTAPHFSCTVTQDSLICSENTTGSTCLLVDKWMLGAQRDCGCTQ